MDAKQLLKVQTEDAEYQLEQCLTEFPEEHLDTKPLTVSMSPREIVGHLCEVYTALEKIAKGEKHEWGLYRTPTLDWPELIGHMKELRTRSIDLAMASDEPKALESIASFVIAHDNYHVGQLVTLRLNAQPGWNSFCIYRH